MGHRAARDATNSFLKDRPREELAAQIDARATKGKNKLGDGEGEDEQAEPALRTEQISFEDIPGGDEIEEEDGEEDREEEEEEEEEESASDDEGESDEADSDGEVDDTSRYAEL